MQTAIRKLISASALLLALVAFTSCRVENVPGIDSILEDISGNATASMATHLSSVSQSKGNFTEDFKEGFKEGYIMGIKEASRLMAERDSAISSVINTASTSSPSPPAHSAATYNTTPTSMAADNRAAPVPAAYTPSSVPSYGYSAPTEVASSSNVYEIRTSPSQSASSSSYRSSSSRSTSRFSSSRSSRRGCAGGT